MNRPPTVSVVLPTHNRAQTLGRAIRSVLDQTFDDFELIIVDDRSCDATPRILEEYIAHSKVRIITQLTPGCGAGRNVGVCASSGQFIAFQDSDDEWLPQHLEAAMKAFAKADRRDAVFYSDMLRIELNGEETIWKSPRVKRGLLINDRTLDFQVCCIGIQSAVIRRECFWKSGLFDERMPRFIDLDLFIRLANRYDFIYSSKPQVKYYAGKGISTDLHAQAQARRILLDKYRTKLSQNDRYLSNQERLLRLAEEQARLDIPDADAQRPSSNRSFARRMLDWYGSNIKYRYLLPVYRLLGSKRDDRL